MTTVKSPDRRLQVDSPTAKRPTVLYVAHNHPSVRPGGAEAYALELYQAMRDTALFSAVLLAKGGPPMGDLGRFHNGTYFEPVGQDPNQYFFHTDGYDFDWLRGTITGKDFYTKHFRDFLMAVRPDIVHFQHTLFLGYEMIREVRNTLPGVPIVYTLHEYLPICHNNGQMVRTASAGGQLCERASPRRCHECFPGTTPQDFFMRSRFIQAQLGLVDLFLAPSAFLRQRFVDWGIPEARIRVEEYGRLQPARVATTDERPRRDRLGFFGQLNPYKGIDVLLEAMLLIAREDGETSAWGRQGPSKVGPRLRVHGANLDLQEGGFQAVIGDLLELTKASVGFVGRYSHEDLPALMRDVDWVVVPSKWWENSPLVIQEAFAHGRPVICSDIGGMAEKVTDGVNGIHFPVGDPAGLANAIRKAVEDPNLWSTLRGGIPDLYAMTQHISVLTEIYRELLERA